MKKNIYVKAITFSPENTINIFSSFSIENRLVDTNYSNEKIKEFIKKLKKEEINYSLLESLITKMK